MAPHDRRDPRTRAEGTRIPTKEERAAEREQAERLAARDRLRDLLWTSVQCFFWCGVGLFLIGSAFHTTDEAIGRIYFNGGLVVGNAGIMTSIYLAFLRARDRGDLR